MIDYSVVHACQHEWKDQHSDSTIVGLMRCPKCRAQSVYAPQLARWNGSNYSIVDYEMQDAKWKRMLGQ